MGLPATDRGHHKVEYAVDIRGQSDQSEQCHMGRVNRGAQALDKVMAAAPAGNPAAADRIQTGWFL